MIGAGTGARREKQPQTGLHIGDFIGTAGGTQPFIRAILHRHARCRSPQNAARAIYTALAKKSTGKIIAAAQSTAEVERPMQPQRLKSPCSQSLLKTTAEVPWQGPRTAVFAAFSSHLRGKLLAQKIIIDKSNAYAHGKDLRLNFRMLEVYHDGARALITKESGRNQELINAW